MTPKASLALYKTRFFQDLLRAAADFYDATAGYDVAERFLSAVDVAIDRISENPYAGPLYRPPAGFEELEKLHYRQLNLAGFSPYPYTIFYEIERDRIVIQSIYHHSRDRERLLSSEMDN